MLVAVKERWDESDKGNNENWEDVDDEFSGFVKGWKDRFVVLKINGVNSKIKLTPFFLSNMGYICD